MRRKLLDSVLDHGHVRVCNNQVVAILSLHKPTCFQEGEASVDLANTRLHSVIVQIDLPEFLVLRILLHILKERGDRLKASLSDTWSSNLGVKRLDSLNGVFHELCWRLLICSLLLFNCACAKPLALVTL